MKNDDRLETLVSGQQRLESKLDHVVEQLAELAQKELLMMPTASRQKCFSPQPPAIPYDLPNGSHGMVPIPGGLEDLRVEPVDSLRSEGPRNLHRASTQDTARSSARLPPLVGITHSDDTRDSAGFTERLTILQRKLQEGNNVFKNKWVESLWRILEDPGSSMWASLMASFHTFFAIGSVVFTLLQSVEGTSLKGWRAATVEMVIEIIFAVEYIARLFVSPNKQRFFMSFHNLVDLASMFPFVVRAFVGFVEDDPTSAASFFLLEVIPTIRLLKTLRHFDTFKLLIGAFKLSSEAMPALLFMLGVVTLSFAAMLRLVEPSEGTIPTYAEAIWLVIVTTTTVGYGAKLPDTALGTSILSILIICSVLYLAVPLGMVGNSFVQVWCDRDRILLTQATRERLQQWGYEAQDVPILFRQFDSDGNGVLDVVEFTKMVRHMGIRLSDERCIKLFEIFDQDGSGEIDDVEFVRHLWPEHYGRMYQTKRHSVTMGGASHDMIAAPILSLR